MNRNVKCVGTLSVNRLDMSQLRISGNPADWKNWEKLIQRCDTIEELTDVEKEKTKRAFLFLKREFGEEFLEYAVDGLHPIAYYIINSAPWTSKWLTRFAEALKSLKEVDGYASLVQRLKHRDKFFEGESVLEVAYKFSKAGFKITVDPLTIENKKVPDLKIVNEEAKEELFVEVSNQQQSINYSKALRTFDKISEPLTFLVFLNCYSCGRVFKVLSERHLSEIVKQINERIELMKNEDAFQELIIDDTIELAIAPNKDKDILEKWAESRGLKVGEFRGPLINADELQRTKAKIQREQEQLPRNSPNILVIGNNNLFFNLHDVRKGIGELEECVYEFSHILFFIVRGDYEGTAENEIIMKDQHLFIKRSREDLNVEQYMILLNRYCDFPVSPATISKVYLAFGKY